MKPLLALASFGFTPDEGGRGYRAFFLPMRYSFEVTFEWIEPN